jgi:uncharacterized protein YbjT (DUF2867 family)
MVVVAGATGYLGGRVARVLHEAGLRVRALARDESRLEDVRSSCDEVFVGQATRPETLRGLCDGAFAVFSSVGVRHVRKRPTFFEVDRDANLSLVRLAEEAGAERFVFISISGAPELRDTLELMEAREQVGDRLGESALRSTVIRPTGLFNDMAEFFGIARRGRVWLIGRGEARVNPIHGSDVGDVVAEVLGDGTPPAEVDLGGPEVFTMKEIRELAFDALQRPRRFGYVPLWAVAAAATVTRPLNRNLGALLAGVHAVNTRGAVAPRSGKRRLADYYAMLARAER